MWAARCMRPGDRVVNICEQIIFTATGEMQEFAAAGAAGAGRVVNG